MERLTRVRSVDLATEPATTHGLYESKGACPAHHPFVIPDGPVYPVPLLEQVEEGEDGAKLSDIEADIIAVYGVTTGLPKSGRLQSVS